MVTSKIINPTILDHLFGLMKSLLSKLFAIDREDEQLTMKKYYDKHPRENKIMKAFQIHFSSIL